MATDTSLRFEQFCDSNRNEALHICSKIICEYDPVESCLKIPTDIYERFVGLYFKPELTDDLSFVAKVGKGSEAKVVAALVAMPLGKEESFYEAHRAEFEACSTPELDCACALLADAEKLLPHHDDLSHILFLACDPQFQRRGAMKKLMKLSEQRALELKLKGAFAECTNIKISQLCNYFGFSVLGQLRYAEWEHNGKKPLAALTEPGFDHLDLRFKSYSDPEKN